MSVIVNIHLETDLSEFTSTVTDSGDLYWAAAAALAGTAGGMACLIDDTTVIYGTYNLGSNNTSGKLRWRFYLDPNSLTMATYDEFFLNTMLNSSVGLGGGVFLRKSATSYQIYARLVDDASAANNTAYYDISDAPHYIEVYLQRAATNVSSDGSLQLWIDGVSKETITGKDNYDKFVNFRSTNIGAVAALDAGTSGTFYLDELVVNDDGGEIGSYPNNAVASITLGSLTKTITGTVTVKGAASITLGAVTEVATGTVTVKGAASITLGAVTEVATGTVQVKGAASITLGALTKVATGTVRVTGISTITLGGITKAITGTVTVKGAAAITLGGLSLLATGTVSGVVGIAGTALITLGGITEVSTGIVMIKGNAVIILGVLLIQAGFTQAIPQSVSGRRGFGGDVIRNNTASEDKRQSPTWGRRH